MKDECSILSREARFGREEGDMERQWGAGRVKERGKVESGRQEICVLNNLDDAFKKREHCCRRKHGEETVDQTSEGGGAN